MAACLRRSALLCLLTVACSSGTEPGTGTDWIDVSVTFQDAAIVVERVSYRSDGLTVSGQVCRPADVSSGGDSPCVKASRMTGSK